MIPHFGFPAVDVRDVAEMHIRALERPETAGERILSVSSSVRISTSAEAIAEITQSAEFRPVGQLHW
jgi:dihydroflavonol-4-reductase